MKEDARGGLGVDLGVGLSALKLIKTLDKGTAGSSHRNKARRNRNTTDEKDLRRTSAHGLASLLAADVDLNVSADSRKTLEFKVLVEAAELKKVVEGRAHVPAQRILLVSIAMREGVVRGVLLGYRNDGIDGTNTKHVELALFGGDGLFATSNIIAGANKGKVNNIDGIVGCGIGVSKLATEVIKDLGKGSLESGTFGDNTKNTVPDDALVLWDIGEAERPVACNDTVDVLNMRSMIR